METSTFFGFGGIEIVADLRGSKDDPLVLMLPSFGLDRTHWAEAADALVKAGRRVISVDLRGHGDSQKPRDGRYDFDVHVEDLRCLLAQLSSRPAVVASSLAGWVAAAAIGDEGNHLVSGLVVVDPPTLCSPADAERTLADSRSSTACKACDPALIDSIDAGRMAQTVSAAMGKLTVPVLVVHGAEDASDCGFAGAETARTPEPGKQAGGDRLEALNAILVDFLERKAPRTAPQYRSGSDARTLRDAMGCFSTGVTVVTARGLDGAPIGLTANSFTSVSLDPPLLLVCIANTSTSLKALEQADHFAVNVLHIGQQQTSNLFARPGEDRFGKTNWTEGEYGAPLLDGSLANFECSRHAMHEGGDHIILVGRVERARFEPRRDPLLYFRGKYRRLHFA